MFYFESSNDAIVPHGRSISGNCRASLSRRPWAGVQSVVRTSSGRDKRAAWSCREAEDHARGRSKICATETLKRSFVSQLTLTRLLTPLLVSLRFSVEVGGDTGAANWTRWRLTLLAHADGATEATNRGRGRHRGERRTRRSDWIFQPPTVRRRSHLRGPLMFGGSSSTWSLFVNGPARVRVTVWLIMRNTAEDTQRRANYSPRRCLFKLFDSRSAGCRDFRSRTSPDKLGGATWR